MHLHHVAIRAQDPEALKAFYCPLFGGQTNGRDHKPSRSAPTRCASRGTAAEGADGYEGLLLSESPRNMAGRLRQPGKAVNQPG